MTRILNLRPRHCSLAFWIVATISLFQKKSLSQDQKINRTDLIYSKKTVKPAQQLLLITRYSGEHRKVRQIIQKFWPLLSTDEVISKYVQPFPQITYRKSRSLKDQLVHSHLMPKVVGQVCIGITPYGKCEFCRFVPNSIGWGCLPHEVQL